MFIDPTGQTRIFLQSGRRRYLSDSTYTDDWIGYGPAVPRYFQTYVGTCSLIVAQIMSISSVNNSYVQYKQNQLGISVTPSTVTVTRDTASKCETYPQGGACPQ